MIHNTITANAKAFEKNWPSSNQTTHRRYPNCPQGTEWAWWFVFMILARHKTYFHIWQAKDIETHCVRSHWKRLGPRWWLCSLTYSLIKCTKKSLPLFWPFTATSMNTFLERGSVLSVEITLTFRRGNKIFASADVRQRYV